jgi:hypothetical protein
VIVDLLEFLAPRPAVILEQTDHLTLLAVHADDGLLGPLEPVARALDGQELTVSSGAVPRFMLNAGFDILAIGLEREAHLVPQARHRIGTDFDTETEQLLGNLLGGLASPAQAAHRIAGDSSRSSSSMRAMICGFFSPADGRPPPRLRTPAPRCPVAAAPGGPWRPCVDRRPTGSRSGHRRLQLVRQYPFRHSLELAGDHLAARHALPLTLTRVAGQVHDHPVELLLVHQRVTSGNAFRHAVMNAPASACVNTAGMPSCTVPVTFGLPARTFSGS